MKHIPGPKVDIGHPDRRLTCEETLEAAFQELAERAEAAGWHGSEVALALVSLAENHILARAMNAQTDEDIAAAKTKIQ